MIDELRTSREAMEAELRRAGAEVNGQRYFRCPFHDDRHPSAEISQDANGVWRFKCHAAGCGVRGDVYDLRARLDGRPVGEVLREAGGQRPKAAPAVRPVHWPSGKPRGGGEIVTTYDYRDAGGELVYQVVRFEPKGFSQRRPDGKGGWTWNMNGVARVLFRLPEVAAADPSGWVFIVEGEKDVDNLMGLGLTATCNPGGAGKWSKVADTSVLDGRRVAIIADRDAPGSAHAKDVAARLDGKAAVVKLIELPDGETDGRRVKDVSDWIEWLDGRSPEELAAALVEMAENAPVWTPVVDGGPVLVRVADVEPKPIRWLWPGRLALGKLSMVAGDPGLGKSFLTLDLAARVSRGSPWPDGSGPAPEGHVILLSAEDDIADTIRPRLDAAGADLDRVHVLQAVREVGEDGKVQTTTFCLERDLAHLETAIRRLGGKVRLVIVDPVTAYLGKTDSHKNADIRGLLAPLSALAAKSDVAIVAVSHLNKNSGGPAMYRTMGSLAFVAAARAVFAVTKDKNDPDRRLVLPVKNNLGPDGSGLAYRLQVGPDGAVPVVAWEADPVTVPVDDALRQDDDREGQSAKAEAVEWLRDMLTCGPLAAKEIKDRARGDGISLRTLDRAKDALGVRAHRVGFGADGCWQWALPGPDPPKNASEPKERQP